MSGSAKAGTIAERHACELRVLPEFAGARSSEARFRRIFFSLTKTYMEVGNPSLTGLCKLPVIRPECGPDLPAEVISATLFSSRSGTFRQFSPYQWLNPYSRN